MVERHRGPTERYHNSYEVPTYECLLKAIPLAMKGRLCKILHIRKISATDVSEGQRLRFSGAVLARVLPLWNDRPHPQESSVLLKKTRCHSTEAIVRTRRLLFAGALARQPDGRLPKRLAFGALTGGEDPGPGCPKQNWLKCLRNDFSNFRSLEEASRLCAMRQEL